MLYKYVNYYIIIIITIITSKPNVRFIDQQKLHVLNVNTIIYSNTI